MERDPRQNDLRRERRARRVRDGVGCIYCGEIYPLVEHHLPGVANDERMVGPVCLNHHERLHEAMRHYGVDLRHEPPKTRLEKLLQVLRGLTALFSTLATALETWTDWLAEFIDALNRKVPAWNDIEEAW